MVAAFQEAYKRGIHRTVHAGESGGPKEVLRAIEDMHAERIGHGYRVMRDEQMYIENFVTQKCVHLEACPYSSVMTGAVPLDWENHPIARWAKDDVNFSVSRDDPTCFDNTMMSELTLVHKQIGLDVHQLWKAVSLIIWFFFQFFSVSRKFEFLEKPISWFRFLDFWKKKFSSFFNFFLYFKNF